MNNRSTQPASAGTQAEPAVRKPYAAPVLTRFGAVRDITQGGTTGNAETPGNCQVSKVLPCPTSDIRVKENVVRVGDHSAGFGLYLFQYRPEFADAFGQGRQFGVIAQEVEEVMPEAVSFHASGFKQVDYAALGIYR